MKQGRLLQAQQDRPLPHRPCFPRTQTSIARVRQHRRKRVPLFPKSPGLFCVPVTVLDIELRFSGKDRLVIKVNFLYRLQADDFQLGLSFKQEVTVVTGKPLHHEQGSVTGDVLEAKARLKSSQIMTRRAIVHTFSALMLFPPVRWYSMSILRLPPFRSKSRAGLSLARTALA